MSDNPSTYLFFQLRVAVTAAALLGVAALWRAVLGFSHYRSSLSITDDPSIRELEQVTAFFEFGLAAVLLAHTAVALIYTRRPLRVSWAAFLGVATISGILLAGTFAGLPVLGVAGVYPSLAILGLAVLGYFFPRCWLSFYLGAFVGSVIAWSATSPTLDAFVGLFVVVPSIILALIGAGVGSLLQWVISSRRLA